MGDRNYRFPVKWGNLSPIHSEHMAVPSLCLLHLGQGLFHLIKGQLSLLVRDRSWQQDVIKLVKLAFDALIRCLFAFALYYS